MGYSMSYIEENGHFTFGGVKSSDYGVWIKGGGTYNAPARRYKEYVVPGRNGSLTIDEGVYEEIEHIYPAFITKDFSDTIENIRNRLCAVGAYADLEDSYHPNEYYKAKFLEGISVDAAPGGKAGSFNLKFKRDPRRFLKSGRKPVTYPYGERHSPNLLPYPYYDTTKTSGNIKWTDNGDGTVSTSGYQTTAASVTFVLKRTNDHFSLPVGEYILSGCPKGGSSNTYYIHATKTTGVTSTYNDYGNGVTIPVTSDTDEYTVSIYIAGQAHDVNGLTFKPMIRNKYGENLITWPYEDGTSETEYGVTFTATDGSVATSGTNTGTYYSRYMIRQASTEIDWVYLEKGKEYKLTGCPAGGGDSKYYTHLTTKRGYSAHDTGSGGTVTITSGGDYISQLYVQVERNVDSSGLVFTPTLRPTTPAEDIGYVPYWVRGSALYNPTPYESKPTIRVYGSGTVTINSNTITIDSGQTYVDIDSEMQDCYTGSTNKNDKVSFSTHKFPTLKPGVNAISYTGSVTSVEITPMWWIL